MFIRNFTDDATEAKIGKCDNWAELRTLDEGAKMMWSKSIQPVIELLEERTRRCALKGVQFKVYIGELFQNFPIACECVLIKQKVKSYVLCVHI